MPTKKRRIMEEFQISELSSVDRPAQAHAKMTIMKRADDDDLQKIVVNEAIVKAWLDPADGARPFTDFLEATAAGKHFWSANEALCAEIDALNSSIRSVIGDESVATNEKESMLRNAVEEFLASVRSKWPDVEAAFSKMLTDTPEPLQKGDLDMPVEKTAAELQKQIDDLNKKLTDTTADLAKAQADLTAEKSARADAEFLSKMDEKERAFFDALSDEDKEKARKMSDGDRKKMMTKALEADEILKVDGTEIRKSVVGDAQFVIFKAMAKKNEDLEKRAQEDRDALAKSTFEKRAADELGHLPGDVVAKGAVLKAVDALPEAVRKDLDAMLKAGEAAIVSAFNTVGHRGEVTKKAASDFNKRVDEIAARDKIGKSEAMQKARKEFPDEFKAYQGNGGN